MNFPGEQSDSSSPSRERALSADANVVITGRPRRAPAAAGSGIPADADEAYRRGICVDCKTAWHAAGHTRCDMCQGEFIRRGRPTGSASPARNGREVA